MTIEPTEFDMIALARRGLQALFDEACAEVEFARRHAFADATTRQLTPESAEARDGAPGRAGGLRPPGALRGALPAGGGLRGMSDPATPKSTFEAFYRWHMAYCAACLNLTCEEAARAEPFSPAELAWINGFRTPLLKQPLLLAAPEQRA